MKRMALPVAVAAGMMVIAGAAGLLGSSNLFESTPEDVAERFVRTLVTGDYDAALGYIDQSVNRDIDTVDLRHFALFIMLRSGEVRDIRGVREWVKGQRAEASAQLMTDAGGNWSLNLKMVRAGGSWAIAEIGSIHNAGTVPN